jgi:alpha-beta hydrolase superfamily lysophospholipase
MEHREGSFQGHKDLNIYYQCWLPEGSARAVLLVAHGYAEHSGRYQNVVDFFVPKGYAIYALDHRGHGRSDGERVQVDHYTDYLADLKTFFDVVHAEDPSLKVFLVGHSMGAMISIAYAAKHQDELAGLILSGGGIATDRAPARRPGLDLAEALSRDRAVVEAYRNDPLVYHGPPRFARGSGMGKMRGELPQMAATIKLPVLIMAGGASPLGEGAGSQALYDVVSSKDKTLKLYEELLHEIFNEPEHREVMAGMDAWLSDRV